MFWHVTAKRLLASYKMIHCQESSGWSSVKLFFLLCSGGVCGRRGWPRQASVWEALPGVFGLERGCRPCRRLVLQSTFTCLKRVTPWLASRRILKRYTPNFDLPARYHSLRSVGLYVVSAYARLQTPRKMSPIEVISVRWLRAWQSRLQLIKFGSANVPFTP